MIFGHNKKPKHIVLREVLVCFHLVWFLVGISYTHLIKWSSGPWPWRPQSESKEKPLEAMRNDRRMHCSNRVLWKGLPDGRFPRKTEKNIYVQRLAARIIWRHVRLETRLGFQSSSWEGQAELMVVRYKW